MISDLDPLQVVLECVYELKRIQKFMDWLRERDRTEQRALGPWERAGWSWSAYLHGERK